MTGLVNQRKAVVELCLFLAVFFVLWTARVASYDVIDGAIKSPALRVAYAHLLKLILWVLPASIFAYWRRGMPPAKYLGVSVLPSLRNGCLSVTITAIFLSAVAFFEVLIDKKTFSGAGLSSLPIALALVQLVISPLFEEILFRGLVMKEFMTLLPTYLANALTSLLFVGAHLPYWLSHGGPTHAMFANALGVFVFSVVAGGLFAKTASIWPPTFAHIANNILSSVLVASRS